MKRTPDPRIIGFAICCALMLAGATRGAEPAEGATRGIVDFKRPADAQQLVGPGKSVFVPEKDGPSQWTFADGVLTASPQWDSVITPEKYQDFRLHVEFNVNERPGVSAEKNGNSGIYIQQRYEVQILNSFGVSEADYKSSYCGSMYRQKSIVRLKIERIPV